MKTYKYKRVAKNFHENIKHPFPMDKLNIAKGTTDPGVDCFDQ